MLIFGFGCSAPLKLRLEVISTCMRMGPGLIWSLISLNLSRLYGFWNRCWVKSLSCGSGGLQLEAWQFSFFLSSCKQVVTCPEFKQFCDFIFYSQKLQHK